MISVQCLIDKINSALSGGGLTSLQTCQLNGALTALQAGDVNLVPTVLDLPDAATYTGRMIYVDDINSYRYSNGKSWSSDFTSTLTLVSNSAFTWGANNNGQLGDGTIVSKSSPVSVAGGFVNWSTVSSGNYHTLGLRSDGTLWAWGCNNGSLGDNSTVNKSSPVSVVGGFTDWCQVSAGQQHSMAVRTNGTLWGWGNSGTGALGNGATTARSCPVQVCGGFTDWVQVASGASFSTGRRSNGTLWAWGINTSGQLGDNTVVSKLSPVSVVGAVTTWCDISSGDGHTLGLRTNGTLWAWGCGSNGRLGDGAAANRSSPVQVCGGITNWSQISAGSAHSLALRADGTAWAWGLGTSGRLGDGTTTARSSPVSIVGGFTDWCDISAGGTHSLGIKTNGTAWSWGANALYQLGDGTTTARSSPVSIVGSFTDWCQLSAGGSHSTGIRTITRGF